MASASLLLRVVVTVAFAASGGYCLRRCVRGGRAATVATRLDDACHVLMAVLMLAALWTATSWTATSWTATPVLAGWSAAVLAVACGWFAVRAVVAPAARAAATGDLAVATGSEVGADCAPGAHRVGRRMRCAHHAVLMALSAWMLAAPVLAPRPAMAGMRMPGGPTFPAAVGVAYCLVISVSLLVVGARTPRRRGDLADAVMAAGMGAMLAAMA